MFSMEIFFQPLKVLEYFAWQYISVPVLNRFKIEFLLLQTIELNFFAWPIVLVALTKKQKPFRPFTYQTYLITNSWISILFSHAVALKEEEGKYNKYSKVKQFLGKSLNHKMHCVIYFNVFVPQKFKDLKYNKIIYYLLIMCKKFLYLSKEFIKWWWKIK